MKKQANQPTCTNYFNQSDCTYKYETHCHTKEGSACAHSTAAEIVQAYKLAGYAGLIITDHFFNGNTAISSRLPWNERIRQFCLGYENGLQAAQALDIDVFLGWEFAYKGTEFLTYGLGKDFLLAYPHMLEWSIPTYLDYVHEAGGFVSHAHPFREADYIHEFRLYPTKVDAVEVVNSSHYVPRYDEKALVYANAHNLLKTSGSDTHNANHIGGGGVVFSQRLYTVNRFISCMRSGESEYIQ